MTSYTIVACAVALINDAVVRVHAMTDRLLIASGQYRGG